MQLPYAIRKIMNLSPHNGTYFRYNMLKKLARMLLLKSKFMGDNPPSNPEKHGSTPCPIL